MLELNDQNFEETISKSQKPVLVDFYAVWCPPCQMLAPVLDEIAKEMEDKTLFARLNIDAAPVTASRYGIEQIPTIILFKEGEPSSGFVGFQPKETIKEWLEISLTTNKSN